jgi:serine O-acetyltransferase
MTDIGSGMGRTMASANDPSTTLIDEETLLGISADDPDWSRERPGRFWDPSRRMLRALRGYDAARRRGGLMSALIRRRWVLSHRFWSVICQADVPLGSRVAGGLKLPHPNGVVIHPQAVIGPNCLIMQQVTIGVNRGGIPELAGHVDVSPGAKILGGIKIGKHALIGANAVVLSDVPEYAIVAGVPARVIGDRREHARLRLAAKAALAP